jgi:putative Holliday junction resolvase
MSSGQGRILGIDYGTRRIGLAISDPLRILATSYGALSNEPDVVEQLTQILEKEQITLIVVGMPLSLSGKKTAKANEVEEFVELIRAQCRVEVVFWDERFSTAIAQKSMLAMGTKKKERRSRDGRIDSMAAAIVLQGFLDSTKRSMSC